MSLDYDDKQLPYTAVRIITDDSDETKRYYEAANDPNDGKTLEIYNPWGTQAMANNILEQISGFTYQPFTAKGAFLSDEAELGDGVWVGNVYGALVSQDIDFDGLGASDISAPSSDTTDNEFDIDYMSSQERSVLRSESRTTSLVVELGQIVLDVQDLETGMGQTLRLAADGVTITNAQGSTLTIDGGQLAANSVTADEIDVSTLRVGSGGITIDSGAITWGNLDNSTQSSITTAIADSSNALSAAQTAENTVAGWTYTGSTYIDGTQIMTGTVTATHLMGGTVSLLASNNTTVGDLTIAYTTTGYGLGITTDYGGIKIESAGNIFLDAGSGGSLTMQNNTIVLSATDLCLSSYSFGSGAPSGTGSYGQVYFQLVS